MRQYNIILCMINHKTTNTNVEKNKTKLVLKLFCEILNGVNITLVFKSLNL